ncbi:unnamed protein product [Phytophthora fragariaefolia]|uniref:Unnamed protein product n=1 Tax=Phytophthora fragariaefolia TaxID=1490495 RepID=A0A9W6XYA3_9STRA|nr:unnamed protein product [Phytophthora fragariaefolia]
MACICRGDGTYDYKFERNRTSNSGVEAENDEDGSFGVLVITREEIIENTNKNPKMVPTEQRLTRASVKKRFDLEVRMEAKLLGDVPLSPEDPYSSEGIYSEVGLKFTNTTLVQCEEQETLENLENQLREDMQKREEDKAVATSGPAEEDNAVATSDPTTMQAEALADPEHKDDQASTAVAVGASAEKTAMGLVSATSSRNTNELTCVIDTSVTSHMCKDIGLFVTFEPLESSMETAANPLRILGKGTVHFPVKDATNAVRSVELKDVKYVPRVAHNLFYVIKALVNDGFKININKRESSVEAILRDEDAVTKDHLRRRQRMTGEATYSTSNGTNSRRRSGEVTYSTSSGTEQIRELSASEAMANQALPRTSEVIGASEASAAFGEQRTGASQLEQPIQAGSPQVGETLLPVIIESGDGRTVVPQRAVSPRSGEIARTRTDHSSTWSVEAHTHGITIGNRSEIQSHDDGHSTSADASRSQADVHRQPTQSGHVKLQSIPIDSTRSRELPVLDERAVKWFQQFITDDVNKRLYSDKDSGQMSFLSRERGSCVPSHVNHCNYKYSRPIQHCVCWRQRDNAEYATSMGAGVGKCETLCRECTGRQNGVASMVARTAGSGGHNRAYPGRQGKVLKQASVAVANADKASGRVSANLLVHCHHKTMQYLTNYEHRISSQGKIMSSVTEICPATSSSCMLYLLSSMRRSHTYKQAIASGEAAQWGKAMDNEIQSHEDNETWVLVPRPKGRNVLKNRWVYVFKYKADGPVDRFKARLEIKEFLQKYGIDYTEIFAPVEHMEILRLPLALAAAMDWEVEQMDVKTAFLNGYLDEEIYREQPVGYVQLMIDESFTRLVKDHCAFIKTRGNEICTISVYVNDLLVIGTKPFVAEIKEMLKRRFQMTDLGGVSYLLGWHIERRRSEHIIFVHQEKYATKVLDPFGLARRRPVRSPEETSQKLSESDCPTTDAEKQEIEKFPYRVAVGSFMYLMMGTRPDLANFVRQLSRYLYNPGPHHWNYVVRGLKYLNGTRDYGITLGARDGPNATLAHALSAYSDADYVSNVDTRRSVSGYVTYLFGSSPISWRSSLQKLVTLSTREAEYVALASTVQLGYSNWPALLGKFSLWLLPSDQKELPSSPRRHWESSKVQQQEGGATGGGGRLDEEDVLASSEGNSEVSSSSVSPFEITDEEIPPDIDATVVEHIDSQVQEGQYIVRQHGNAGNKSAKFVDEEAIKIFFIRLADVHADVVPVRFRHQKTKEGVLHRYYTVKEYHLLPAYFTWAMMHEWYIKWAEDSRVRIKEPSLSSFRAVLERVCPTIRVRSPHDNVCDTCVINRNSMGLEPSEEDTEAVASHIEDAKSMRHHYKSYCEASTPDGWVTTIDFAQNINLPHNDSTPSLWYFLSLISVSVFGIHTHPNKLQWNLIYSARKAKKGSIEVISMLDTHARMRKIYSSSPGNKRWHVYADNCGGQVKNSYGLQFLLFLVHTKSLKRATLSFLVKGHIKNHCDRHFGYLKRHYAKRNLWVMEDIERAANESATERGVVKAFTEAERAGLWESFRKLDPPPLNKEKVHGIYKKVLPHVPPELRDDPMYIVLDEED